MSYRYILRYLIDPHFEAEARIEELIDFCLQGEIEEVMLFLAAEELSAGYPTDHELRDFIALANRLKEQLGRRGIALSLNPWATLYHSPRGRALKEGQQFRLMVGENGNQSPISPCPLCPEWQEYLGRTFAQLVKEIEPVALWVEDDWRLRNHGAVLGWGGCFCEEHLRRFSAIVGQPLTREELLRAILCEGEAHPYRAVWLDLSRESLLEPLRQLSARIRNASPTTRVGLMSGSPDLHAAEGREWPLFQQATSGESRFLGRPSMKPYTQYHALPTPPGITRLTIAHLAGELELYPELENSPRCGAYSKSCNYSAWQIFHSALIGSAGVTINHYDMMGNGISLDPHFGKMLAKLKPRLNSLRALDLDDRASLGVRVLFHPKIAYHRQVGNSARRMDSLSQATTLWADTCAVLGISYRFASGVHEENEISLVNQQTLRCLSDQEVRRLLSQAVVLDAESVAILLERGFGDAIGLSDMQMRRLDEVPYAYEQIVSTRFTGVHGGPTAPRMSAQRCSPALAEFIPLEGSEIVTEIRTADHQTLWPGAVLFRNSSGGRVLSIAYPVDGTGQFFMGFFNVYRKELLQRLFVEMAPRSSFAAVANAPMHAYSAPIGGRWLLSALNPTDDRVDKIVWRLPAHHHFSTDHWHYLNQEGEWCPIEASLHRESTDAILMTFPIGIDPLDGVFFRHTLEVS